MLRTVENAAASPTNIKEQRGTVRKAVLYPAQCPRRPSLGAQLCPLWGNAVNDLNALIGQYKTLLSSRAHEPMPQDEDMVEEL